MSRAIFTEAEWRALRTVLGTAPREHEVIKHVFDDASEAEMARSMGVSKGTVHTYLERLYHKLGVNSRVSLVTRVVQEHRDAATAKDGQGTCRPK